MKPSMYILVNEDIKMSKGKTAAQVGHAISLWIYKYCFISINFDEHIDLFDKYMQGSQRKIILKCSKSKLEELEKLGYTTIRDSGLTELPENTLTCVNLGIYDNNNIPSFISELKLYN